jgi:DNA-binding transcriptional ArsR family regulator
MPIHPVRWALDQKLRPLDKLVLVALADHAIKPPHECFPSLTFVSRRLGISRSEINRTLRRLIEKGLVIRQERSGRTSKLTLVTADKDPCHTLTRDPCLLSDKHETLLKPTETLRRDRIEFEGARNPSPAFVAWEKTRTLCRLRRL